MIPVLAQTILNRIERLVQWSDLSGGYASTEELLDACPTNSEGHIEEPWQMVALGAECWKKAAQIYLLCRLLRYVVVSSDDHEKNPLPFNSSFFTV